MTHLPHYDIFPHYDVMLPHYDVIIPQVQCQVSGRGQLIRTAPRVGRNEERHLQL